MLLLNILLQELLNARKEGKKSLNGMQENANLPGQAVVESLLCLNFQR